MLFFVAFYHLDSYTVDLILVFEAQNESRLHIDSIVQFVRR